MIDSKVLLKALQKQVILLEKDLTPTGLADARLKVEWRAAKSADRTAATFETWLGERVTQVAVAWVLGTVFLRFCEDNGLIEYPFITGPGERADLARDLQAEYFQKHPEQTDRDWIIAGFDAMSVSPVAKGLFDRRHNPMWTITAVPRRGQGAACVLAGNGSRRPGGVRPDRPGVEHPVPRRPVPGPVGSGAQDLRAAPDPGVRRGVHPQVHAGPRDRGVRPRRPPRRPATRTCRTACA